MQAMRDAEPMPYERYLPWRRWVEYGFWLVMIGGNCVANSIVVLMELHRRGAGVESWEPVVWELSSALVWLLLIVPGMAWFTGRHPFRWSGWSRQLLRYFGASIVVCLLHVLGMVALRKLAYAGMGMAYEFGPWPRELLYEYLNDVRSFAYIVLMMEAYRVLLRRWQGEASLLTAPEEGPALERVERPERLLVRKLGREFLVAAADIEWLQAAGNYVNLRVRGHDYPLRSTIAGIETQLDPERFVRIHRSYIVNLGQVASIEPLDSGDARVHLHDATVLPCSRRYRAGLRAR